MSITNALVVAAASLIVLLVFLVRRHIQRKDKIRGLVETLSALLNKATNSVLIISLGHSINNHSKLMTLLKEAEDDINALNRHFGDHRATIGDKKLEVIVEKFMSHCNSSIDATLFVARGATLPNFKFLKDDINNARDEFVEHIR